MAEVKDTPKPAAEGPKGPTKDVARTVPAQAPASETMPWSPFTFMRRFAEEMDRLFEDFGVGVGWRLPSAVTRGRELLKRETGLISADWSPRIDIQQREGELRVHADLPGLTKDDVKVDVTDDMLTIRGERKHEKKEEHEGYAYSECSYGSFYRAIPLPEGADPSKATAEFRNGVLEVTIPAPSRQEPKSHRVEVREGK